MRLLTLMLALCISIAASAQTRDTVIYDRYLGEQTYQIINMSIIVTKPYKDLYRDVISKQRHIKKLLLHYMEIQSTYKITYKGPAQVGRRRYKYIELVEIQFIVQ